MERLETRSVAAETKLERATIQKTALEEECTELREQAKTINNDLTRVRTESGIKVAEYKRQASHGAENTSEIFQRQLAEKENELETLTVRYANLNDELQISRNKSNNEMEDISASTERVLVQLEFYKSENIRIKEEVEALTEASSEGGDAVMRSRLTTAEEQLEEQRQKRVEEKQEEAERKTRRRHAETNTEALDITIIKQLEAQNVNDSLELDAVKDSVTNKVGFESQIHCGLRLSSVSIHVPRSPPWVHSRYIFITRYITLVIFAHFETLDFRMPFTSPKSRLANK